MDLDRELLEREALAVDGQVALQLAVGRGRDGADADGVRFEVGELSRKRLALMHKRGR